jgi:hypothetical protein
MCLTPLRANTLGFHPKLLPSYLRLLQCSKIKAVVAVKDLVALTGMGTGLKLVQ